MGSPADDDEGHQGSEFGPAVPAHQLRNYVRPDDPPELLAGVAGLEFDHGVDRVGRTVPLTLQRQDTQSGVTLDRGLAPGKAVLPGGEQPVLGEGVVAGGNPPQLRSFGDLQHVEGHQEVPDVRGVERAPEEGDGAWVHGGGGWRPGNRDASLLVRPGGAPDTFRTGAGTDRGGQPRGTIPTLMPAPPSPRSPIRGRFAPSPTGALHLGHVQTMLLAWLQVRNQGGTFILRMEDLDRSRTKVGAELAIYEDLEWLGFDWDEGPGIGGPYGPYRQLERRTLYDEAIRRLGARIFACTCTRRELGSAAGGTSGEIRYPGTCRSAPSRPGAPHSLRVRVEPDVVGWMDGILGPLSQDPALDCGDFIVRAKGGDFVYQLAVVVDDLLMGVTHVLRGEDLVQSTGRQILLWRWLGGTEPRFAHAPLRRDPGGERLAKRRGSPGLAELRRAGADPAKIVGQVARELGLIDGGSASPGDLVGLSGPWELLREPSGEGSISAAPPCGTPW